MVCEGYFDSVLVLCLFASQDSQAVTIRNLETNKRNPEKPIIKSKHKTSQKKKELETTKRQHIIEEKGITIGK